MASLFLVAAICDALGAVFIAICLIRWREERRVAEKLLWKPSTKVCLWWGISLIAIAFVLGVFVPEFLGM